MCCNAHCTSRLAGAASQGSPRGLSLLARLAENLAQPLEPLPDMDVDDAPVQDEDCEDGKPGVPGAAAGDDANYADEPLADMPASPPRAVCCARPAGQRAQRL